MNRPATPNDIPATLAVPMLRTLGLVAALSGFLVVLAHHLSLPLIEENKRIAIERALFKVIPGAVTRRDFLLTGTGIEPAGETCLLYTSPSPRDGLLSRMPSSA